ncbi:MAG: phosphatase PAP2 family protein [Polyangia bacterium]
MGLALLTLSQPAFAADPQPLEHRPWLEIDLPYDLSVTGVSLALWLVPELAKDHILPADCRWCDTKSSLNAFDAGARSAFAPVDRHASSVASDVMAFGVTPLLALGLGAWAALDAPRMHLARRLGVDLLIVAESVTTAMSMNQMVKMAVRRRRPGGLDDPTGEERTVDGNLSFFSGHATFAFALATSAGMVATIRRSRLAPAIWTVGFALATSTALLRVAADKHFATDTLAGAAVGSIIGCLVPLLHRTRAGIKLTGGEIPHGAMVGVSGRF